MQAFQRLIVIESGCPSKLGSISAVKAAGDAFIRLNATIANGDDEGVQIEQSIVISGCAARDLSAQLAMIAAEIEEDESRMACHLPKHVCDPLGLDRFMGYSLD